MKHLSDYKGEAAIELWGDLLEPMSIILKDDDVIKAMSGKPNLIRLATLILKSHKAEVTRILLRVDDSPIDGLNIMLRLIGFLMEIEHAEGAQSFFGYAEAEMMDSVSTGSATENTGATEKE